ncbi:unnamed protein product [Danaus chrysippus]|uniref:(African queen) hypothetical protein n=1 Tax=Danaus chrysippus TaxID=151541 RepID=A0A8J2Q5L1_9NEOP|nr:unnamed protein product [Danaus chrysippus]
MLIRSYENIDECVDNERHVSRSTGLHINQASCVGEADGWQAECIGGVGVGTADQAWPPTAVDLLAVGERN